MAATDAVHGVVSAARLQCELRRAGDGDRFADGHRGIDDFACDVRVVGVVGGEAGDRGVLAMLTEKLVSPAKLVTALLAIACNGQLPSATLWVLLSALSEVPLEV